MAPTPEDLALTEEELLAQAGFLQGLVGGLVEDPDLAEDLVQQTWVAALERPPRRRGGGGGTPALRGMRPRRPGECWRAFTIPPGFLARARWELVLVSPGSIGGRRDLLGWRR